MFSFDSDKTKRIAHKPKHGALTGKVDAKCKKILSHSRNQALHTSNLFKPVSKCSRAELERRAQIQRDRLTQLEIRKPLDGAPLCTKAEFERRNTLTRANLDKITAQLRLTASSTPAQKLVRNPAAKTCASVIKPLKNSFTITSAVAKKPDTGGSTATSQVDSIVTGVKTLHVSDPFSVSLPELYGLELIPPPKDLSEDELLSGPLPEAFHLDYEALEKEYGSLSADSPNLSKDLDLSDSSTSDSDSSSSTSSSSSSDSTSSSSSKKPKGNTVKAIEPGKKIIEQHPEGVGSKGVEKRPITPKPFSQKGTVVTKTTVQKAPTPSKNLEPPMSKEAPSVGKTSTINERIIRKIGAPLVPNDLPNTTAKPSASAGSLWTKGGHTATSTGQSFSVDQRRVAIKRRVEESYSVSAKRPFLAPTVDPLPRAPPSPTFARFNPGLAYPSAPPAALPPNLPPAKNITINYNNYYGSKPKRFFPQERDPEHMTRCQKRLYYKALQKAEDKKGSGKPAKKPYSSKKPYE